MASTIYLRYTIYLTDPIEVATLQGETHAGGAVGAVIMAPTIAAATYGAPIEIESAPFAAPCTRSEWFVPGYYNYPLDQRTFERRKSGFFGFVISLFGAGKTRFYWRGTFALAPSLTEEIHTLDGDIVPGALAIRHWADGAEATGGASSGESASGTGNGNISACRGASRHLGGFGYRFDCTSNTCTHDPIDHGAAPTTQQWERFYVRFHRFHTANFRLWIVQGTVQNNQGVAIEVLPTGQIALVNHNGVNPDATVLVLPAIPVRVWQRFDLVYKYANVFDLWLNGVRLAQLTFANNEGMGRAGNVTRSTMGSGAANAACYDIDDWLGCEWPSVGPDGVYNGRDWNNGTKVAAINPIAFAASHNAAWTLTFGLMRQRPQGGNTPQTSTSSTTLARYGVTTDAADIVDAEPTAIGACSLMIGARTSRGVASGTLGYKIGAAAEVLAAIVQQVTLTWNYVFVQPAGAVTGMLFPDGLELYHVKGAGADAGTITALVAVVDLMGNFGPEDGELPVPPTSTATLADAGTTPLGVGGVSAAKADLEARGADLSGPEGAFAIVMRAAWSMRANGAGLLSKTSGNHATVNGQGYSTDRICLPNGDIFDVLGDSGGLNTPAWGADGNVGAALYRTAIDPGDTLPAGTRGAVLGQHNAHYGRSPWARKGTPPISPVVIHAGVYTGNGIANDLSFRSPVHFLWIRNLTTQAFVVWSPAMNAAHLAGVQGWDGQVILDARWTQNSPPAAAEDDQETRCVIRISGAHTSINGVGTVYQYLAFQDPGMRFCECGVLERANSSQTGDHVTGLVNPAFTPEASFVQHEITGAVSTPGLNYKGPGHAASALSPLGATEIASGLAFGTGTMTTKSGGYVSSSVAQVYVAFRRNDGSADVGIPRVLQLASYTGDGSASRTVNLTPVSGRRPLWAIVVPHNAASIMRDPSHLTNTSSLNPGSSTTTGITAGGIDQISVGSTLNANGIVYDVFVLPGDVTAGNGGWSINGEFIPVEPDTPFGDGLFDDDPPDPELLPEEPPDDPPDDDVGDDPDFSIDCLSATTKIVNQALGRLGVSKRVIDVVAELSEEAAAARLHYGDDVEATLRDFPWPFATRYANLVLVAGTASVGVNKDWLYAYRAPADMVFARRIVNPSLAGRDYDVAPPRFRLGADDTGMLVYTNELTPQLEYTIRTECAAAAGDALFRAALTWRHAHSIGPVLSRDEKKVAFCWAMYQDTLNRAKLAAVQEQQQSPGGDPDWITGRN